MCFPPAELALLPVDTIVVGTDGSAAAVEQARTVLADRYPTNDPPQTLSEYKARDSQTISRYQRLANVVLFTSLPIAGCSLAVSIAGGLAERRRPFSLLRLTGVPLVVLRHVVALRIRHFSPSSSASPSQPVPGSPPPPCSSAPNSTKHCNHPRSPTT